MKLDPVMHIGLHLVFFGKTGVTGEAHRLVEVEKSRAAAESAVRRLIHPAIEGPR
jgi:hypothetical protein